MYTHMKATNTWEPARKVVLVKESRVRATNGSRTRQAEAGSPRLHIDLEEADGEEDARRE